MFILFTKVRVQTSVKIYGEQAGLLFFLDQNNYAKLVIEGMKTGASSKVWSYHILILTRTT